MVVYEIDPFRFIPAGFDIVDGGADRLSRTFYTPAIPPLERTSNTWWQLLSPVPRLIW